MNRLHPLTVPILRFLSAVTALIAVASVAVAAEPHKHQHSATGPKGGVIVELGEEELHAELLHDDEAGTVTVYLLDGKAKGYVSVATPEVLISIQTGRRAEQFKLLAKPQKGDRKGQTSRYELKSPTLVERLDDHDAQAKLTLKVGKRSFAGAIPHVHDHDHAHAH